MSIRSPRRFWARLWHRRLLVGLGLLWLMIFGVWLFSLWFQIWYATDNASLRISDGVVAFSRYSSGNNAFRERGLYLVTQDPWLTFTQYRRWVNRSFAYRLVLGLVAPWWGAWPPSPGQSGGGGVRVPLWLMLAVATALPLSVWAFVRWRRRRRIPPGHCTKCGYDLTGNVSGVCSECGTATPGRTRIEESSS